MRSVVQNSVQYFSILTMSSHDGKSLGTKTLIIFQIILSTELNDDNEQKEGEKEREKKSENTEYKIKIIKMIGKMDKLSLINLILFIAEKKIVPGIFLLFSLFYWSFSFLCYFNLFTNFTEID